jgi:hypothetical protein
MNPFVEPREEVPAAEPSSTQTAGSPQVIHNPFATPPPGYQVENLARVE